MKKRICDPRFGLLLSLITAGIAAVLHTVAYLKSYGTDGTNYFAPSAVAPKLSVIFAILSCLLAFSATLIRKNSAITVRAPKGSLTSLPAAIGFLAGGTLTFLSSTTTLSRGAAIFCFLAAVYHVLLAIELPNDSFVLALLGFSAVIACILLNSQFYFDTTLEMNAPLKINVLMGLLVAMLYYVQEMRALLKIPMPRLSAFISASTVAISGLSAISIPLAYLLGTFDRTGSLRQLTVMADRFVHPEYLAGAAVLLGVFITSAWRLCDALAAARRAVRPDKEDA